MNPDKKTIVILGAGYGGLRTALELEKLLKREINWQITLIDSLTSHELKTELHEVAAGRTSPDTVSIPIHRLIKHKRINFFHAEAKHVEFDQRVITTTKGKVEYDKLVIALGSETEFFGIPGLSRQAFALASIDDAERIKIHVHDVFVQAKNEPEETRKRAKLTIIVGGGGFTGVELATELVEYTRILCRQLKIAPDFRRLIVVEAGKTVLPGFDPDLARRAQYAMTRMGIELKLGIPCVSVEDDSVELRTGETIEAGTLIWTGGVRTCDIVANAGLRYGSRNRIVVNPFLESVDHPEVYVIGDNALVLDPITNRPLAPTAQLALQQAKCAALNIYAEIRGLKRVRYTPRVEGQFVSLGDRDAVGWVWRFKVTGALAWLLKRMTVVRYLQTIGGLSLTLSKLPSLFFS